MHMTIKEMEKHEPIELEKHPMTHKYLIKAWSNVTISMK